MGAGAVGASMAGGAVAGGAGAGALTWDTGAGAEDASLAGGQVLYRCIDLRHGGWCWGYICGWGGRCWGWTVVLRYLYWCRHTFIYGTGPWDWRTWCRWRSFISWRCAGDGGYRSLRCGAWNHCDVLVLGPTNVVVSKY